MFLLELPARSPNPMSSFLNNQSVRQLIANLFLGWTVPWCVTWCLGLQQQMSIAERKLCFVASSFTGRDLENVRKRVKHQCYRPQVNTVVA